MAKSVSLCECPLLVPAKCVYYGGTNLVNLQVVTNERLDSILQKIDTIVGELQACCAGTTTTTSTSTSSTTTTTTTQQLFTAYWGWKDDRTVLTPSEIVAQAQGSASVVSGASVFADYTANSVPKYLWMAEPLTEPAKTEWDGDGAASLNQGLIGGAVGDNLFPTPDTSGSFRFYITGYQTQNTTALMEFKVPS